MGDALAGVIAGKPAIAGVGAALFYSQYVTAHQPSPPMTTV